MEGRKGEHSRTVKVYDLEQRRLMDAEITRRSIHRNWTLVPFNASPEGIRMRRSTEGASHAPPSHVGFARDPSFAHRAKHPAKNSWSVVVYDALSRSELQNGQRLASISVYSKPKVNADGSVDIVFGAEDPKGNGNWIKTVPGKGWFPIFRFYGPAQQYFDKTWKLEDIVAVQ